ncbi:hypothetical protein ACF3NA_07950 [Alkanindiges sp. WGS2144]|uniref:hypothetical protein n=1 Tax=Alkanindiges sp. WGS2144 TaxID=3366808 RepID=UPI003751B6B8
MTDLAQLNSAQIVERIGETDQQFLTEPTATLAKTRAQLRIKLVEFSHQKKEQLYFLTEAVVLLETALMQACNLQEHLELSAALGEAYLSFYQYTKEQRYMVISKQVLKALSHYDSPVILLALARLSAFEGHAALVRHWLTRLLRLPEADFQFMDSIKQAPELSTHIQQDWFKQLLQQKLH